MTLPKQTLVRWCVAASLQALLLLPLTRPVSAQGYLPHEATGKMTVPEGLAVTLFASEPDVRQPIFCKCDERGRLWTIQFLQYPNPAGLKRVKVDRFSRTVYDRKPEPPPRGPRGADRITILADTDGDGRADQSRDFVTGLNLCTGLEFGYGGVFVIQAPYLLFYPDRDRDDVPDGDPEVLLDGFGLEDSQSLANHLTWGPDGWLYGLNGSTTTCRIRDIEFQQGVWRYHPVTRQFELFCEGGGNIYGLTFDRHGRLFYSSNGGVFYHGVQGGYYEKNFGKHGPLHNPYAYGHFASVKCQGQTGRPNPGATIYLGDSFPANLRHTLMVSDFLTHTCSWWKVEPRGATVEATLGGLLLKANDAWFGATDLCLGPDGAMYVCDFHDARTAHPDPDAKWDTSNGRIYRIQAKDALPLAKFDLARKTTAELVELLGHPNGWYAQQARRILAERRDRDAWPALRELAMRQDNAEFALQGLWGAYVSGAWDSSLSMTLLAHPSEHVRSWTVRLLGDARDVELEMARRLVELARHEPSVIVRSQLASTAKRLSSEHAIPILHALLSRDLDDADPYVPWLVWWGLEAHAITAHASMLDQFANVESWQHGSIRGNLRRLLRRYAAEGTKVGSDACQRLWESTPLDQRSSMWQALHQGLVERPRELAAKRIEGPLRDSIHSYWSAQPDDLPRLRVALEVGLEASYATILGALEPKEPAERLQQRLSILVDYGREDCVTQVLALAEADQPEAVRQAAFAVLRRFPRDDISRTLLRDYPRMSDNLKSLARELLLSRPASTLALLRQVEAKQIPAAEIPLEQLRPLALFESPVINSLVRQHWGNITPGTPEEKLADVRRFSNDLRAGSGNAAAGIVLYQKHCGNCHKLHGVGNSVGPDLSGTVKGDPSALLISIVDPNAVVRREFLSYVLVDTSGGVRTGLLVEQDAASVTILNAKNERVRVSRTQIDELREASVSLMPERLLEQLTPQELRDLFAYLQAAPPTTK